MIALKSTTIYYMLETKTPDVRFYVGPMGSGKTTELLKYLGGLSTINMPFASFKSKLDIREDGIKPRQMPEEFAAECVAVAGLERINAERLVEEGIETILLEEAHMFGYFLNHKINSGVYERTMRNWGEIGIKYVIGAALNISASKEHFPFILDAEANGAELIKLYSRCQYPIVKSEVLCGQQANNSQIYSVSKNKPYRPKSLPALLPQGDDKDRGYRAVCPSHLNLPDRETLIFKG